MDGGEAEQLAMGWYGSSVYAHCYYCSYRSGELYRMINWSKVVYDVDVRCEAAEWYHKLLICVIAYRGIRDDRHANEIGRYTAATSSRKRGRKGELKRSRTLNGYVNSIVIKRLGGTNDFNVS